MSRVEKAVIIAEPWISEIFAGLKVWEMRTRPWAYRGQVGLIRKGSGLVVGVATLVACHPALYSLEAYAEAEDRHRIPRDLHAGALAARWCVPWELRNVRRLEEPVPYRHPMGAVTTVNLEPSVTHSIERQL